MKSALQTIAKLEQIVQRDEGGRGMRHLCQPSGTLATTALALFHAQNVVLMTGFPCLMQHDIPTETDGPSGTVAICRALTRMDMSKKVVIVTDDRNKTVIEACANTDVSLKHTHWHRLRLQFYCNRSLCQCVCFKETSVLESGIISTKQSVERYGTTPFDGSRQRV